MDKVINVAFVGNPNCGKTTLFNAYTGANLKVANWPGVTVEKVEGQTSYKNHKLKLVDLPGIYSLTSYTLEERVSRKCIFDDDIDVVINVVDASSLERNLYLTLQLLEMGKPVILALNMMDIVKERGMEIDLHRLPEMLGNIPVVPVSARKRTGLDVLMHAVVHHYEEGPSEEIFRYNNDIEERILALEKQLKVAHPELKHLRWHAIKLLENDEEVEAATGIHLDNSRQKSDILACEKEIIKEKYRYIEEILEDTLFNKAEKEELTDRIDTILTHKYLGLPIFFVIIAVVFFFTFTIGDALKGVFEIWIEDFAGDVTSGLEYIKASDWLISLIVDGIIGGVGGILTFLPNIVILFIALALMEDSGYMSRVAYVMDGIMSKAGLSGKAFLPMVLGFGCSVPAVMATRALESNNDRKRLMYIIPFMSCSAKLPIYVLLSEMFFGKYAAIAAYSMYVLGVLLAIIIAVIMGIFTKKKSGNNLLIELPEYKKPNGRTIRIYVWEKVKDYLTKAGTVIFVASILLWFLLNFGTAGMTSDVSQSFGAMIGKLIVPIMKPAGLGMWQIVVALISGLSAKEVVVSSMSVLFGVSNVVSETGMGQLYDLLGAGGFGVINAYSLMVFCLLYTPCVATIGTIKRESGSLRFTLKVVLFQLLMAYVMATLVYQVGSLII